MHIKTLHIFIIGSRAFFSEMSDYQSKDVDKLAIIDSPAFGTNIMNIRKDGNDTFFMYNYGKDKLIDICLEKNIPMAAGKFLVPEFAKYINLTIDDLKKLIPLFNKIDLKHSYEKIILNSYIANNDFILTDEQLNESYEIYKKYKNVKKEKKNG